MLKNIVPYHKSEDSKKKQVEEMFDNISGDYDKINRMVSLGKDISWRRNLVNIASKYSPSTILDIATGTADLAIDLLETGAKDIVGIDISEEMIQVGKRKVKEKSSENIIRLQISDAENLGFPEEKFDMVTVSFGIRNFEDLQKGLTEIKRVLKPGGKLLVLETSVPNNYIIKLGYYFYSKTLLPLIGLLFSKDKSAYRYLAKSSRNFPYGKKLKNILLSLGYKNIEIYPQTLGVATIYSIEK